jgi:hypothetical protein
MQEQARKEE